MCHCFLLQRFEISHLHRITQRSIISCVSLKAALRLSKEHKKYIQETLIPSDHIWMGFVPFYILLRDHQTTHLCECPHVYAHGHTEILVIEVINFHRSKRERDPAGLLQHNGITRYFAKWSTETFGRRSFNPKSREFKLRPCQYLPTLGCFLGHLRTQQLAQGNMPGSRLTATTAKMISQ